MKPRRRFSRVLVFAILFFLRAFSASAQSITVLYNFSPGGPSPPVNSDGAHPLDFIPYQGRFYGITYQGGDFGEGVIYSINMDGADFRTLHIFGDGEDVGRLYKPLMISDGVIYGTSELATGGGAIFAINTDGSNYHYVRQLSFDDGTRPLCELTIDGDTLYGTAADNGPNGGGTVFSVKTNGLDFVVLHAFDPAADPVTQTNVGGFSPGVGLTLNNGVLYGGTVGGGKGAGTIFKLNVDGSGFTVLHEFAPWSQSVSVDGYPINPEGSSVSGKMLILGGKLYGATDAGGSGGVGVIFTLSTNGTGFKVLHSFPVASSKREVGRVQTFVAVGNRLYGSGWQGGAFLEGALFQVDVPAGTYKTLYNFPALDAERNNTYGAAPESRVFINGSKLYFTASGGGTGGNGIVGIFPLPIPPATLGIARNDPGIRILVFGELGVTYSLEQSQTLSGTDWQAQTDVTVSQIPQPVDLPAPAVATFWRAKVQ
jgi:uncharacterized repeat protein (TIGR03803 family)